VFVAGNFKGAIDLGGGALQHMGQGDIFVARLSPQGAHVWSKRFGDGSSQMARDIAVDAAGAVVLAGNFDGTVDIGGGALTAVGVTDALMAKLSPAGAHVWSRRAGSAGGQVARAVAVDPTGSAVFAGYMQNSGDFGGGTLTSAGANDVFAAKYDAAGAHVWSKIFGDSAEQHGFDVLVDAAGNVALAGKLAGKADFGGGPLTSVGGEDVFLVAFGGAGQYLYGMRFGETLNQWATSVAVDSVGSLVLGGRHQGKVDFGSGPLTSPQGSSIFLAKIAP
jgi:hypothetical protein